MDLGFNGSAQSYFPYDTISLYWILDLQDLVSVTGLTFKFKFIWIRLEFLTFYQHYKLI